MENTPEASSILKLVLSPNEFVMCHAIASFFSVLLVAVVVVTLRHQLTPELIKETLPGILKILTVYLIIWAGTELALVNAFNQGISTLFAAIIGYVFGSFRMSPGGKPKGGGPPSETDLGEQTDTPQGESGQRKR